MSRTSAVSFTGCPSPLSRLLRVPSRAVRHRLRDRRSPISRSSTHRSPGSSAPKSPVHRHPSLGCFSLPMYPVRTFDVSQAPPPKSSRFLPDFVSVPPTRRGHLDHVVQDGRPRRLRLMNRQLRVPADRPPDPSGWERGVGLMAPRASRRAPPEGGGAGPPRSRVLALANPASHPDPHPAPDPADSGTQGSGTALPSKLDHAVHEPRGSRDPSNRFAQTSVDGAALRLRRAGRARGDPRSSRRASRALPASATPAGFEFRR
jgi:hypothetical protein